MAQAANELYQSQSVAATTSINATVRRTVPFASGSGTLIPGHPVAFNTATSLWVPWANAGANGTGTIRGFVIGPDSVVLDAANETNGNIMLRGEIHLSAIVVSGGTLAQLKTALLGGTPTLRELGIDVIGVAGLN